MSDKRVWLNLALAVLLLGMAALAYFKPGTKPPAPAVKLTELKPADIHSLRIERPGKPAARFERDAKGHWQMLAPLKAAADSKRIDGILADADETSQSRYRISQLDLTKLGLKPPKLKLFLNGEEFDFGGTEPLNYRRYIRHGDTVHLVSDMLYFRLAGDPDNLLRKQLLPDDARIDGIQIPGISLNKGKDGHWQVAPANPRLTSDDIQHFIDAWRHALAFEVKPIGKEPVQGEVAISMTGMDKPLRFQILTDKDALVLARPDLGIEYALDSPSRQDLLELKPAKSKTAAPANQGSNDG